MSEPLIWVIGSGGLLGSHVRRALDGHIPKAQLWQSQPLHFSWTDRTRLKEELSHAVPTFAAAVRAKGGGWALLWCAGNGAVNSTAAALEPEWWAWTQLLDLVGLLSERPARLHLPG